MNITFEGKRALVTGAGRGFGRTIARDLYNGGATVYALSKTKANLDSLKEELPGIHTLVVDLADWNATRTAVQDIGPIDLLVNNAGILYDEGPMTTSEAQLDEIFAVNLKAVVNVTQIIAEGMIARGGGGSIVNLSSIVAKRIITELFAYSLSKAALQHTTQMFAVELGKHKIRVNSVNPTVVLTDMVAEWMVPEKLKLVRSGAVTPMEELPQVQDISNAVLYLLSDKSNFVTGESLLVDGGFVAKK